MFFFDPLYLVVLVVTLAITGWAAWRVRSTYAKWAKVDSGINLDAFDFARQLLDRQGLNHVKIEPTPGQLTDHYDPRGKVLRVSTQVADARALETAGVRSAAPRLSVAAAAVIAGSTPRSLRLPASEVSLCRRPVRNIETASQCAASTSTRVVVSEISVVSPPMTPPRPMIPLSSVTTRSSGDSARSTPSSFAGRSSTASTFSTGAGCSIRRRTIR